MLKLSDEKDLNHINNDNDNDDYYEDYDNYDNEINYNNENEDSKFLKEYDIIKEREKIISQAKEKLFLKREDAILALIYYKWNIDKLDNWYENIEENKINSGIELSKEINKKLINEGVKPNGDKCLICWEKVNNNFFSLNCGHQFCNECWTGYLNEKIKSPLNALQAKCPQNGCTCIVYENLYSKFLKNNNSIKNLNISIYQNFINRNDDIKKCPNEKCEYFIKSNNHYEREIICLCGTSFCYKCLNFPHFPCPCDIIQKWCEITKKYYYYTFHEDQLNDKWIKANTKECPNCHQKIEKNKGCNYMYCNPKVGGCGHAFCYVCETDWKDHIKNHYYCNNYNSEEVKKKEIYSQQLKKELEIDLIEEEFLKKENFNNDKAYYYFKKYKEYDNSITNFNILKNNLGEKVTLLSAIHNLYIFDLNFINNAIEAVINAYKLIKISYIFAYFMKEGLQKNLFTSTQELLKFHSDCLYNKLNDKYLNNLIEIDSNCFPSVINVLKTSINYMTVTINNCINSFIEDIENEYISELDDKLIK